GVAPVPVKAVGGPPVGDQPRLVVNQLGEALEAAEPGGDAGGEVDQKAVVVAGVVPPTEVDGHRRVHPIAAVEGCQGKPPDGGPQRLGAGGPGEPYQAVLAAAQGVLDQLRHHQAGGVEPAAEVIEVNAG